MQKNGINQEDNLGQLKTYINRTARLCLLLAIVLFAGCERETGIYDGPLLVDRFGEFELLEPLMASQDEVDFSAGESVYFTASFNKRLDFVLRITGQSTGAVKTYELFDNALNQDNSTWLGGTTLLPFFGVETCSVEMIIPEEDSLTYTIEIEVTGTKEYEGDLFTGFETLPGDNIFFGNFEFELTNNSGRRNNMQAAEGNWHYFLQGTDNVVPNFFVGLIDIKSSITGQTYAPVPTTIPSELYFNCFMWHDGSPLGIAVLQFAYDTNGNGEWDEGIDETFQIEGDFPLNWVGWRHIYHPMSELEMTEEQVSKIVAIRALLISDLNSQPDPPLQVNYGLDYLTFTEGRELQL